MTEIDQTPELSPEPKPAPYNKWKDKEFIKQYYRERQRQKRGLKRHPNIMEDGSLWSESHPYGRFETHREKLDNMAKYRTHIPKVECQICGHIYFQSMKDKHPETKKHKLAVQLLKRHNVI